MAFDYRVAFNICNGYVALKVLSIVYFMKLSVNRHDIVRLISLWSLMNEMLNRYIKCENFTRVRSKRHFQLRFRIYM